MRNVHAWVQSSVRNYHTHTIKHKDQWWIFHQLLFFFFFFYLWIHYLHCILSFKTNFQWSRNISIVSTHYRRHLKSMPLKIVFSYYLFYGSKVVCIQNICATTHYKRINEQPHWTQCFQHRSTIILFVIYWRIEKE